MSYRPATNQDCHRLGEIHVAAWQAAYEGQFPAAYLDGLDPSERAEYWSVVFDRTGEFGSRLIVAERQSCVVGFACFGPAFGEQERGELYAMNIDPPHWRAGIGSELLQATSTQLVEMALPDSILWTGEANARGRSFYEAHGWEADGSQRTDDVHGQTVREIRFHKMLGI